MVRQPLGHFRLRVNLLTKILAATLVAALVPLAILSVAAYRESQNARNDTIAITRTGLNNQALSTLKMQAVLVAAQISQVLTGAVADVRSVAGLPPEAPYYLAFYRSHTGTLHVPNGTASARRVTVPLYRELTYIDASGNERLLIRDGQLVPPAQLRNISNPRNTTYKIETYYADTRALPPRGIYMSHVMAWNATNPLQSAASLAFTGTQPRTDGAWYANYIGVLRIATPLYNAQHRFMGMVMLSLDARFIMDPVIHLIPGAPNGQVGWPAFSGGSYGFVWDDQGWLIAHPLLSRLRGLNEQGKLPSAADDQAWVQKQSTVPFNMYLSTYLPQQPFMYSQVRQQRIGSVQGQNAGGVQRVYVYAPVLFSPSGAKIPGVFGGVGIGTYLNTFYGAATAASNAINSRVDELLTAAKWIGVLVAAFIILLAVLVSLSVTRPLARLASASRDMGHGKLDLASLEKIGDQLIEDEVTELARSFKWMAEQVQQREQKLREEVADLHIQIDLKQQERQVDEITGTDWFQYLSQNAENMRSRNRTAKLPAADDANAGSTSAPDQPE